ncbi:unnamed protein product [Adineta ricciae]|uniref:Uncharacterized protein n=1 Tax=Adineta ricciae TaxID=249248 RepID=A0A816F5D8_ADIRI|nr:unnamed protein product [Adineta ricciae]CAF1658757.1 unnamed protein product [Adineta ricciae]
MSRSNTQPTHSPIDSLSGNHENECNIDQLLFVEPIPTNQSQSISFNMTNMVPSQIPMSVNAFEHNNMTQRREIRRNRRRRQRQRRRERREALRQQQQQQQQHLQSRHQRRRYPRRSGQRRQERYQRWQARLRQWELERNQRSQRRRQEAFTYVRFDSLDSYEELIDEIFDETLLEVYEWEKTDPNERWEQEQINELEGLPVFEHIEQLTLIQDELEQLEQINHIQILKEEEQHFQLEQREQDESIELKDPCVLEYISRMEDDIEQLRQIDALQTIDDEILEEQKEKRDNEEIIQMQQWEHIAFLLQQFNQT